MLKQNEVNPICQLCRENDERVVAFDGTAQKKTGPKKRNQRLIIQEKPLSFMELNNFWQAYKLQSLLQNAYPYFQIFPVIKVILPIE